MISARNRFHGHASLKYLYRNARSQRSGLIVLKFIANSRRNQPRIAVVVSKKVHKSAVGRNRIRRRLYELMRAELPQLATYDIALIVVSAEVRTLPATELAAIVQKLLADANVYKKP